MTPNRISRKDLNRRHRESIKRTRKEFREVRRKARRVNRQRNWKKFGEKLERILRLEFLKREPVVVDKQVKYIRMRIKKDRREIRKREWQKFKKRLLFKRDYRDRDEKIIRQKIRQDRLEIRLRNIVFYPSKVLHTWKWMYKSRVHNIKGYIEDVRTFVKRWKHFRSDKELLVILRITTLNSIAIYLLTYFLFYYFNQYITVATASFYNIPTELVYYIIKWKILTSSSLWTRTALIVIFGLGPFLSLILGFVFLWLFDKYRGRYPLLKIFFMWAAMHGFNMFLGAYVVGVITRTGFILTSEWLFLSNVFDIEEIIFLVIALASMLGLGVIFTTVFLKASNSKELVLHENKVFYLIGQALLPWMFGIGFYYLYHFPNYPIQNTLLMFTPIFIIAPAFANYNSSRNQLLMIPKVMNKRLFSWRFLLFVFLVLAAFRIFLQDWIDL